MAMVPKFPQMAVRLKTSVSILSIACTGFSYLLAVLLAHTAVSLPSGMEIKYKWKYVDYKWANDSQKADAIECGTYNQTKIYILDVQPLPDGRVVVTMPNGLYDNPATLATVSDESGPGGPLLAPYPNWSCHTVRDCSGITHIRRVVVDDHNRMWAVDVGWAAGRSACAPKIIVFNLTTDEILQIIEIPDDVEFSANARVYDIETSGDSLEDVTLYISDFGFGKLVIWNGKKFLSWTDAVFHSDADQVILDVGGYTLNLSSESGSGGPSTIETPPTGIFSSLELVFFKPLASVKLFFALRSQLLNCDTESVDYYVSNYSMPHQEIQSVVSSDGIRFGGASTEMTITCWNMRNPLTCDNVKYFDTDEENLQYPSALKVLKPSCGSEELWVASDRMTRWFAHAIDWDDYNYRVLVANVEDLVAGTVCDSANAAQPEQCTSAEEVAVYLDFSLASDDS